MYNLEDPSLSLDLSSAWEYFVGTYAISLCQAHRSQKVISSFIDGVIFNPNKVAALPHEGTMSMVREHGVRAQRSTMFVGHHEGVAMRLDLSKERDREVGISLLVKHQEMRIDGGPKNASNAVGLKSSAGHAMYASDVKLDGKGVKVRGRRWFQDRESGVLTFTLNESYLRKTVEGEIRGKSECETVVADIRGRRGVSLQSLTIDGKNVGVEELENRVAEGGDNNRKSEWRTKVEIRCPDHANNSNPLLAEEGEEEGKKKKGKKKKKKKKGDEGKVDAVKKEIEVVGSIQLRHPSVVFTSVIKLNLLNPAERAAFKTYVGRARICPGEGMLDVTLDGGDLGGDVYDHTWEVPR